VGHGGGAAEPLARKVSFWRTSASTLTSVLCAPSPPPQAEAQGFPVQPQIASIDAQAELEKQDSYAAVSGLAILALTIITVLI
jgi:hypothetical protein